MTEAPDYFWRRGQALIGNGGPFVRAARLAWTAASAARSKQTFRAKQNNDIGRSQKAAQHSCRVM